MANRTIVDRRTSGSQRSFKHIDVTSSQAIVTYNQAISARSFKVLAKYFVPISTLPIGHCRLAFRFPSYKAAFRRLHSPAPGCVGVDILPCFDDD
jgi:hypothetical protein